jgi:hypothetical protein
MGDPSCPLGVGVLKHDLCKRDLAKKSLTDNVNSDKWQP